MFKIERNVPLPPSKREKKYPVDQLQVGDSFFVPATDTLSARNLQVHLTVAASRQKPKKFTTRQVDGGVRIWRTK